MNNFKTIFVIVMIIGFIAGGFETGAAQTSRTVGFDLNKVPIVNSQVGKFPYFTLIDGYEQDNQGSYSGSKDAAYDRYELFDGAKLFTVEGKLKTVTAKGKGSSAFEMLKTYESLVKKLGGVRVFEGSSKAMYKLGLEFNDPRHRPHAVSGYEFGVYVIRMPDREIWVEAYYHDHLYVFTGYHLTVVETQPLKVRAAIITAEEMKKELDSNGHVALYLNFETDKADIKTDSQPVIDEMVRLLTIDASLKLAIEGHTDNTGTVKNNKQLSQTRANAVVAALTKQGIEASRLKAVGMGQNKPIEDNSTAEGRAKNRRVELVKVKQ